MLRLAVVQLKRIAFVALTVVAAACNSVTPAPMTAPASPVRVASALSSGPEPVRRFEPASSLRFEHISTEQGMSQSTVRSTAQDSRGFMWFGTEDGLNRFDGNRFKVYKHDPDNPATLGNNAINVLLEDSTGALWVGLEMDGLDRFDPFKQEFSHYRVGLPGAGGLSDDRILALYEDSQRVLWVGTAQGLTRVDLNQPRWQNFGDEADAPEGLRQARVTSIYESRAGLLWFGTDDGLVQYDRAANAFRTYRNDPYDPQSLSSNSVSTIAEDATGALWLGTAGGGINILDSALNHFTRLASRRDDPATLSSNNIVALHLDRSGTMWVGTYDRGINRYDPDRKRFARYSREADNPVSLSNDNVRSLYEDRTGVLWVGTFGGGVNIWNPASARFLHYRSEPGEPASLSHSIIFAVHAESTDVVWIGTQEGLDRLDRTAGRFDHYQHDPADPASLAQNTVRAIYRDRKGTLWIGTEGGGLDQFDAEKNAFLHHTHDDKNPDSLSSNVVAAFYEDESGKLWIGTGAGLDCLDPSTGRFTHYPIKADDPATLSGSYVLAIYPERSGQLWVATTTGLNKFNLVTGEVTRYVHNVQDPNSLSGDFVLALLEDRSGTVWVGTYTEGLNKLDPASGQFTQYRQKQGLPNDTVYAILEDGDGFLWMSTNKGITKFDPRTETFVNYDASDGVQGNEFDWGAFDQSAGGEMFFGGTNGLTAFYPADIADRVASPPVVLTELTRAGEPLPLSQAVENVQELSLAWPDNYFEFEFAALDPSRSSKLHYAYLLEGFDSRWNEVGDRRTGRYTNLPGGTYTLHVVTLDGNGTRSPNGLSLTIQVIPPLWETWWFRGSLAMLLVAGALAAYQLRIRDIRARNRALEKKLDESTWALRQQTRELGRQQQELQALYRADEEMYRHLEVAQVLAALVDVAVDICHADKSSVLLWDTMREQWAVSVSRGFDPDTASLMRFGNNEGVIGQVVSTGQAIMVDDAAADPRREQECPEIVRAVLDEGIRSFMQIPIMQNGKVFAVFNVNFQRPRAIGQDQQRVFVALAQRAERALENARLFKAEQRRADQFRVIGQVGHDITSVLDVDELLNEIVGEIKQAFGYYVVGIALVEGDELVIKAAAPKQWQALGIPPLRLKVGKEGVMGWVAATGQPSLVPDASREPRFVKWPKDTGTRSELVVPLRTKSGVIGVLNVESDRPNAFDDSDLMMLQSLGDQAAVAIENAQLFNTEKRRAEQFQIIAELGRRMTTLLDVDEILSRVVTSIQRTFGYYHVAIGLVEADELVFRVGSGALWDDPGFEFKPARLKLGKEGITGWVAAHGEPLVVPDVSQEPRYVWMQGSATRSELAVPILGKQDVIGVLDVQSDQPDAFDSTDLAVVQALANQTSAAIENARLYEHAQELATLQERNRLARDLHDAVTQTLFSASLIADALPPTWERDPGQGRDLLRELRQLSRGALAEMRTLLLELRPAALVETPLGGLLRQLGEAAAGREGLEVHANVIGDCKLPPDVHIAFYRIAQEALNNIVKHARPKHVGLDLSCEETDGRRIVVLTVSDDGRGFDPSQLAPGHFGMSNMKDRASAIGAELCITSRPGQGTSVRMVWETKEGAR